MNSENDLYLDNLQTYYYFFPQYRKVLDKQKNVSKYLSKDISFNFGYQKSP